MNTAIKKQVSFWDSLSYKDICDVLKMHIGFVDEFSDLKKNNVFSFVLERH